MIGAMGDMAVLRATPALEALVELPAGRYTLGEPGEERSVELARVLIGRYPVVNAHLAGDERQARRPAARRPPRHRRHARRGGGVLRVAEPAPASPPPTSGRRSPAAPTRAPIRGASVRRALCACAEARWGWTVPVTAHPRGASPVRRRAARRQRLGVGRGPHARRLGRRQGRLLPRHRLGPARLARAGRRPRRAPPPPPASASPSTTGGAHDRTVRR